MEDQAKETERDEVSIIDLNQTDDDSFFCCVVAGGSDPK